MNNRIKIFLGHFGSGKTEIALNCAKKLAIHKKVALVDLDVINSYFRSREVKNQFNLKGIWIIAPEDKMASADLPIISPQIKGVIANKDYELVLDVGGDDLGARALASLAPLIRAEDFEIYMVINPYRPYTKTLSQAQKMFAELKSTAKLGITSIISNPNLGLSTTVNDVLEGHHLVEQLSEELSIPIKWICTTKHLCRKISDKLGALEVFPLDLFMQPPWELKGISS